MKKLQILDTHALASWAKQLAVTAFDPNSGGCHTQIAYRALGPAVNTASFLTATMTNGSKSFAGLNLDSRLAGFG
jgi:hypothetical protein